MTDSTPPWHSERELGTSDVRAMVREQFELPAESVEPLGTGWDSEAYLVDHAWVFRFPKRAEVVGSLQAELAVLPLLAKRLPLRVPEPRFIGKACGRFPFPFAGYRMIPGVAADAARHADKGQVLEQVFGMLTALHAIELAGPVADLEGWGFDVERESVRYLRRLKLEREPLLRRALDWLADRPPQPKGERVLLHGDLGFEHVLLDPSHSRVTGVIDWGDMELGARAGDFVGPLVYAGMGAVERALERSRYPAPPSLLEDARALVVNTAVIWWCEAVEYHERPGTGPAAQLLERFMTA